MKKLGLSVKIFLIGGGVYLLKKSFGDISKVASDINKEVKDTTEKTIDALIDPEKTAYDIPIWPIKESFRIGESINNLAKEFVYSKLENSGVLNDEFNLFFKIDPKITEIKSKLPEKFNTLIHNIRKKENKWIFSVCLTTPKGLNYFFSFDLLNSFESSFKDNQIVVNVKYFAVDFWSICQQQYKITGLEGAFSRSICEVLRDNLKEFYKDPNFSSNESILQINNRVRKAITDANLSSTQTYLSNISKKFNNYLIVPNNLWNIAYDRFDSNAYNYNIMLSKTIFLNSIVKSIEDEIETKKIEYDPKEISDDYNVEGVISFFINNPTIIKIINDGLKEISEVIQKNLKMIFPKI